MSRQSSGFYEGLQPRLADSFPMVQARWRPMGSWPLIRFNQRCAPDAEFCFACSEIIGICVRHVCRDTNWLPVSVTNPQSHYNRPSTGIAR